MEKELWHDSAKEKATTAIDKKIDAPLAGGAIPDRRRSQRSANRRETTAGCRLVVPSALLLRSHQRFVLQDLSAFFHDVEMVHSKILQ